MHKKYQVKANQRYSFKCEIKSYTPWDDTTSEIYQEESIPTYRKEVVQKFLNKVIKHNKSKSRAKEHRQIDPFIKRYRTEQQHRNQERVYKKYQKEYIVTKKKPKSLSEHKINIITLQHSIPLNIPRIIQIGFNPEGNQNDFQENRTKVTHSSQEKKQQNRSASKFVKQKLIFNNYSALMNKNGRNIKEIFSNHNNFIGKKVGKVNKKFAQKFDESLKTISCEKEHPIINKILKVSPINKISLKKIKSSFTRSIM